MVEGLARETDYDDAEAYTPGAQYYITAVWSRENLTHVPMTYTVGDESVSYANGISYLNAKLKSNTDYSFSVWIELEPEVRHIASQT